MKYSYRNCKVAIFSDEQSHRVTVARLKLLGYDPTTAYRCLLETRGLVSPADAQKIEKLQEISSFITGSCSSFMVNHSMISAVERVREIQNKLLDGTRPRYLGDILRRMPEFSKETLGFDINLGDLIFLANSAGDEVTHCFVSSETYLLELIRSKLPQMKKLRDDIEELKNYWQNEIKQSLGNVERLQDELHELSMLLEKNPDDWSLKELKNYKRKESRKALDKHVDYAQECRSKIRLGIVNLYLDYVKNVKEKKFQIDLDMRTRNKIPFGKKNNLLAWLWDIPESQIHLPESLLSALDACKEVVKANKRIKEDDLLTKREDNSENRGHLYWQIEKFYNQLKADNLI